jgi:hypothetical protein
MTRTCDARPAASTKAIEPKPSLRLERCRGSDGTNGTSDAWALSNKLTLLIS